MRNGAVTVLHVVSTPQRRGAEQVAWGLAAELSDLGVASTVVAWSGSPDRSSLPIEVMSAGRFDPRGLGRLVRAARTHDVIVAHGGTTLWPSVVAGVASRRPVVYRNIGDPAYWVSTGLRRLRVRLALRRAAAVVALYPAAATWMSREHGVPSRRFHVIPNAVAADDFPLVDDADRAAARRRLGLDADGRVVAYVGALSAEKRPDRALDVAERLEDVEMLVAGDGPLRAAIEARATALGDRVHVLGNVVGTGDLYAAADLVVIPSDTEGVPGVLLESICSGTPVVGTDVGGVADLLTPGRGTVVPTGDVDALVAAVDALAGSGRRVAPSDREALVAAHSLSVVVHQWRDVLQQVAAAAGAGRPG